MTDIVQEFRMHAQGEKRAETRQRVLKRGVLTFFGGYCTREAKVRSLSQNGARLDFDNTDDVPAFFRLAVGDGNTPRSARVRWRSQSSLGVQFENGED